MKLNLACRMIRLAEDGEKHRVLVNASRLCGGYIAAGKMEQEEVVEEEILDVDKVLNKGQTPIEEGPAAWCHKKVKPPKVSLWSCC